MILSPYWPLISGPYLPDFIKTDFIAVIMMMFFTAFCKTDFILGHIKYNLTPLKVFYHLKMDIKSRHKLTEKNYKRLAILSRIITVIMLNYASPTFVILTIAIGTSFTYMSWQLYWFF